MQCSRIFDPRSLLREREVERERGQETPAAAGQPERSEQEERRVA